MASTGNETIKVMIINDEKFVCELWQRVVNSEEDMTCVAIGYNGDEAIRQSTELQPDVIVMDIMMPGMDGFAATRHIVTEHPQIAVILFTAGNTSYNKAIEAGAVDCLFIPIMPDELVESIRKGYASKNG